MLKDKRNLLWLVPLAALATLPLWKPFAADFLNPVRQTALQTPPSAIQNPVLNSSTMTGVQFEQSNNGSREWLITASRLFSFQGEATLQFEDVKALFFNNSGNREKTSISSKQGTYNSDSKLLTLAGKVIVKNGGGYEMRTDSLEYQTAKKKIRTTSAVNITGSNIEVRGSRLIYDLVTGDFSLAGNVRCRIW